MDVGERYHQLSRLGRDTFCAAVAQATLVRPKPYGGTDYALTDYALLALGTDSGISDDVDAPGTSPLFAGTKFAMQGPSLHEIIPLTKKLGTPFVDLITLGRTDGNDISITHKSVSRFQAFFRRRHGRWFVCDAGSSNGTQVNRKRLRPRTEVEVLSHSMLQFGGIEFQFHTADSLFDMLMSQS